MGLAIQAAKQRLDEARGKLLPRRRFAFAGRSRAPDQAAGAPAAEPGSAAIDPVAAAALPPRDPNSAAEASAAASSAGASDGAVHVVADRPEEQPAKQAGASMLGKDEERGLDEAAAAYRDGVLDTDWCAPKFCKRAAPCRPLCARLLALLAGALTVRWCHNHQHLPVHGKLRCLKVFNTHVLPWGMTYCGFAAQCHARPAYTKQNSTITT